MVSKKKDFLPSQPKLKINTAYPKSRKALMKKKGPIVARSPAGGISGN